MEGFEESKVGWGGGTNCPKKAKGRTNFVGSQSNTLNKLSIFYHRKREAARLVLCKWKSLVLNVHLKVFCISRKWKTMHFSCIIKSFINCKFVTMSCLKVSHRVVIFVVRLALRFKTNNRCIGVQPANKGPRQRVCHKKTTSSPGRFSLALEVGTRLINTRTYRQIHGFYFRLKSWNGIVSKEYNFQIKVMEIAV